MGDISSVSINIQSASNAKDLNYRSCWDEQPTSITNNTTNVPNATTAIQALQIQLLGVVGVLLIILAVVLPVTVVLSGVKGTTTVSTVITTLTTVTITTTTASPYVCSNMTFLNNTDLGGNDITPFPALNYSSCCAYCLNTTGCVAFTWGVSGPICYRKTSAGTGGTYSSALVSARY